MKTQFQSTLDYSKKSLSPDPILQRTLNLNQRSGIGDSEASMKEEPSLKPSRSSKNLPPHLVTNAKNMKINTLQANQRKKRDPKQAKGFPYSVFSAGSTKKRNPSFVDEDLAEKNHRSDYPRNKNVDDHGESSFKLNASGNNLNLKAMEDVKIKGVKVNINARPIEKSTSNDFVSEARDEMKKSKGHLKMPQIMPSPGLDLSPNGNGVSSNTFNKENKNKTEVFNQTQAMKNKPQNSGSPHRIYGKKKNRIIFSNKNFQYTPSNKKTKPFSELEKSGSSKVIPTISNDLSDFERFQKTAEGASLLPYSYYNIYPENQTEKDKFPQPQAYVHSIDMMRHNLRLKKKDSKDSDVSHQNSQKTSSPNKAPISIYEYSPQFNQSESKKIQNLPPTHKIFGGTMKKGQSKKEPFEIKSPTFRKKEFSPKNASLQPEKLAGILNSSPNPRIENAASKKTTYPSFINKPDEDESMDPSNTNIHIHNNIHNNNINIFPHSGIPKNMPNRPISNLEFSSGVPIYSSNPQNVNKFPNYPKRLSPTNEQFAKFAGFDPAFFNPKASQKVMKGYSSAAPNHRVPNYPGQKKTQGTPQSLLTKTGSMNVFPQIVPANLQGSFENIQNPAEFITPQKTTFEAPQYYKKTGYSVPQDYSPSDLSSTYSPYAMSFSSKKQQPQNHNAPPTHVPGKESVGIPVNYLSYQGYLQLGNMNNWNYMPYVKNYNTSPRHDDLASQTQKVVLPSQSYANEKYLLPIITGSPMHKNGIHELLGGSKNTSSQPELLSDSKPKNQNRQIHDEVRSKSSLGSFNPHFRNNNEREPFNLYQSQEENLNSFIVPPQKPQYSNLEEQIFKDIITEEEYQASSSRKAFSGNMHNRNGSKNRTQVQELLRFNYDNQGFLGNNIYSQLYSQSKGGKVKAITPTPKPNPKPNPNLLSKEQFKFQDIEIDLSNKFTGDLIAHSKKASQLSQNSTNPDLFKTAQFNINSNTSSHGALPKVLNLSKKQFQEDNSVHEGKIQIQSQNDEESGLKRNCMTLPSDDSPTNSVQNINALREGNDEKPVKKPPRKNPFLNYIKRKKRVNLSSAPSIIDKELRRAREMKFNQKIQNLKELKNNEKGEENDNEPRKGNVFTTPNEKNRIKFLDRVEMEQRKHDTPTESGNSRQSSSSQVKISLHKNHNTPMLVHKFAQPQLISVNNAPTRIAKHQYNSQIQLPFAEMNEKNQRKITHQIASARAYNSKRSNSIESQEEMQEENPNNVTFGQES